MITIEELLNELPPKLKTIATPYFKVMLIMTPSELRQWANHLLQGEWGLAYKLIVSFMSMDELAAETKLVEAKLLQANRDEEEYINIRRKIGKILMTTFLLRGKTAIIAKLDPAELEG